MQARKTPRRLLLLLTSISALIALSAVAFAGSIQAQQGSQTYTADLSPINANGNNGIDKVTGNATFTINGDELKVEVKASGLAPNMVHPMHVHVANDCPDQSADKNGDGFVDVKEAASSTGDILIPLDSDLRTQDAGDFPKSDDQGNIDYTQTVSISTMMADLQQTDTNKSDSIAKLGTNDQLNLGSRSVMIHGVSDSVNLPNTVASEGDSPANVTLPVACGTLSAGQGAAAAASPSATGTSQATGATGATGAASATPSATGTSQATGATGAASATPSATGTSQAAGATGAASATPSTTGTPQATGTPSATSTPSSNVAGAAATPSATSTPVSMQPPVSGDAGLLDQSSGGTSAWVYAGIAGLFGAMLFAGIGGYVMTTVTGRR